MKARHLDLTYYVEYLTGDGATIFEHVCKLGLEGIVANRIDMGYQPGRSKRWLKIKNPRPPIDQPRARGLRSPRASRPHSWPVITRMWRVLTKTFR